MKIGDTVKVLSRRSVDGSTDIWRRGKVLDVRTLEVVNTPVYKVGFGEFSSYEEREFERHEINSYLEQSDDEFNANFERDLPIGLVLANEALAELLPGEVVAFKDSGRTGGAELSGYHGNVTVTPTQYDQPKIGGLIQKTGYEVTVWSTVPSTRWHPEEYVDASVGTYPTIQQAVQEFVQTVFNLKNRDYWQSKADAAQVAAWEADM